MPLTTTRHGSDRRTTGATPLEPDVIVPEEFEDEELYRNARRGLSDATDKPSVVPQEDIEEAGSTFGM